MFSSIGTQPGQNVQPVLRVTACLHPAPYGWNPQRRRTFAGGRTLDECGNRLDGVSQTGLCLVDMKCFPA